MNISFESVDIKEDQLRELLKSLKNISSNLYHMSDKAEDTIKSIDILTENTKNNLHILSIHKQ